MHKKRSDLASAQGISPGGVEAGADQDQLGIEGVGDGQHQVVEGQGVLSVTHPGHVPADVHVEAGACEEGSILYFR